jgi:hypothetical protein
LARLFFVLADELCFSCGGRIEDHVRHLYHYTTRECLKLIQADGQIRQVSEFVPAGEKPAVWFSFEPEWEETANKPVADPQGQLTRGTKETTHALAGGLVRIAVKPEAAPIDWTQYKKLSGISADNARSVFNAALSCGMSVKNWRSSFEPVPESEWISIEYWDGREWRLEPPELSSPPSSP